jgi:hypothetical protein
VEISRSTNGRQTNFKDNFNVQPPKRRGNIEHPQLRWRDQHTLQEEKADQTGPDPWRWWWWGWPTSFQNTSSNIHNIRVVTLALELFRTKHLFAHIIKHHTKFYLPACNGLLVIINITRKTFHIVTLLLFQFYKNGFNICIILMELLSFKCWGFYC